MYQRRFAVLPLTVAMLLIGAPAAYACGGLIGSNGNVNLLRTTTMAGYAGGVEHYVTSFSFAGGGGEFGSLVPLPGIPTQVERGGDWTLQRLIRETQSQPVFFARGTALAAAATASAEVILETTIDALEITVLKGGGDEVGRWAKDNGFSLPPDAPEVLDFYAERSPTFLAARFDAEAARARGQNIGEGTPIHLTIPTDNPWVPLRILALGKQPQEQVQADVYLLTEGEPALGPLTSGVKVASSASAPGGLLADLAADQGMGWIPRSGMWLTFLRVDAPAAELTYDLATNVHGGTPSAVDAGLESIPAQAPPDPEPDIPVVPEPETVVDPDPRAAVEAQEPDSQPAAVQGAPASAEESGGGPVWLLGGLAALVAAVVIGTGRRSLTGA